MHEREVQRVVGPRPLVAQPTDDHDGHRVVRREHLRDDRAPMVGLGWGARGHPSSVGLPAPPVIRGLGTLATAHVAHPLLDHAAGTTNVPTGMHAAALVEGP
jgi:hypothetical protein